MNKIRSWFIKTNKMRSSPNDLTCDIIEEGLTGGGAAVRPLPVAPPPCSSLPPSPCQSVKKRRRGRRLPCSLPCSPLLRGRSSTLSSPALSRLWVEAALQRSKTERRSDIASEETSPNPQPVDVEEEGWSGEEDDEGTVLLFVDADRWRYCQLTPCHCSSCPSAPPFDAALFFPEHLQRTEGDGGQSLPTDGAPPVGSRSCLYPSLGLWQAEDSAQTDGHNADSNNNHLHGNSNASHPQQPSVCVTVSD